MQFIKFSCIAFFTSYVVTFLSRDLAAVVDTSLGLAALEIQTAWDHETPGPG